MSHSETCFFERYAKITLSTLLGRSFDGLINADRPDLQTPDGHSLGIEVTRAMEQNKREAEELIKEVAGVLPREEDMMILSSGYGYGLGTGKTIGTRERFYWELAKPLKQILQSKVSKVQCGLYGSYDSMGLYVFCKDSLSDAEVIETLKYVMDLQQYASGGYDTLYLSEINELHVCNLRDGLNITSRVASYPISQEQRSHFFLKALEEEL